MYFDSLARAECVFFCSTSKRKPVGKVFNIANSLVIIEIVVFVSKQSIDAYVESPKLCLIKGINLLWRFGVEKQKF